MNQVLRIFSNPHFGLPRDLGQEPAHGRAGREGRDENQTGHAAGEQVFQLFAPFTVDRAGTGHRFDEQEPIPLPIMNNHVGHFRRSKDNDTKPTKLTDLEMEEFVCGIPDVDNRAARSEAGTELLDDLQISTKIRIARPIWINHDVLYD